jgi:hypothetical protein
LVSLVESFVTDFEGIFNTLVSDLLAFCTFLFFLYRKKT